MAASRCRRCCGVIWVGLKSFPDGLVEKSAPHPPTRGTLPPRAGRRESRARAPLIRPFGAPSPRRRGEGMFVGVPSPRLRGEGGAQRRMRGAFSGPADHGSALQLPLHRLEELGVEL